MHKYTAKLSLLLLLNLEASIYDEGVLSDSLRGFCPEGAYVFIELCMEGVLSEGVLSEGILSGGGFVLPSCHVCVYEVACVSPKLGLRCICMFSIIYLIFNVIYHSIWFYGEDICGVL